MPSVLPDLTIFPTRPAEPRHQSATRDREGPSRFESLVDESEPDTPAANSQPAPARDSKSSPPAKIEPTATPSDSQAAPPAPAAAPAEAAIPDGDPIADFAAVTASLAAVLDGSTPPEGDTATDETADGGESDADPAAIVAASAAPEQPPVTAPTTTPTPPAAPVIAGPVIDGATSETAGDSGIVDNVGQPATAPAMPVDQIAGTDQAVPKDAASAVKAGSAETAQIKSGDADDIAADDANAETDITLPAKDAFAPRKDQDADKKAETPPAPPARPDQADGAKSARTPNETAEPVAATEERTADHASKDHPQPLALAEHQSAAAQAQTQASAQTQSRPIVQAVPVAAVAVEIAAQARAGKTSFEIRLDPPELGRIDVRLDIDHDGKVTSRLTVERAETLDVLRRDAHSIERALNEAGLKTSDNSLQFSLRDQGNAHRDRDDAAHAERLAAGETELAAQSAAPIYNRLPGLGGGLDIRV